MGFCASWPSLLPVTARAALILTFVGLFVVQQANGTLTQSRLQNRHLQRVMNHHRITIVLEGVRARALNSIKPDPILLINFPEIDYQFKVRDLGTYLVLDTIQDFLCELGMKPRTYAAIGNDIFFTILLF